MRTGQTFTLPTVRAEFDPRDERVMRRTVEQHLEDLRTDVVDIRNTSEKSASLALKRHQFLLMGAR